MIKVTLPMPPSANRYWRTSRDGRVYVSDEAKTYKSRVRLDTAAEPLEGDLTITVKVYRAQKTGDLDNRLKVLFDALKGLAFSDDRQIAEIHAYRFEDKRDPRVEVEVSNL